MTTRRYTPLISSNVYFAGDGSGMAVYDAGSGDTHFLYLDSKVMKELLTAAVMTLDDLQRRLSIAKDEASELAHEMISLGLMIESD